MERARYILAMESVFRVVISLIILDGLFNQTINQIMHRKNLPGKCQIPMLKYLIIKNLFGASKTKLQSNCYKPGWKIIPDTMKKAD